MPGLMNNLSSSLRAFLDRQSTSLSSQREYFEILRQSEFWSWHQCGNSSNVRTNGHVETAVEITSKFDGTRDDRTRLPCRFSDDSLLALNQRVTARQALVAQQDWSNGTPLHISGPESCHQDDGSPAVESPAGLFDVRPLTTRSVGPNVDPPRSHLHVHRNIPFFRRQRRGHLGSVTEWQRYFQQTSSCPRSISG